MYWNGTNLYLTGSVNATGGKFTGNVQLAIPAGSTTSGTLYAGANSTSGARVRFSSEGIFAYDSTSTSNETGQTFSLVQSTGRLNATLGTVGGWTLATTGLSATGTSIESNGTITLGDTTGTLGSIVRMSATDPNYRLWVGSQTASNAKFKVGVDGTLYATGAVLGLGAGSTIEGYATSGSLDLYTLNTVTTGINSRLQTVEGDYVAASTLSSGLATKNTIFVTSDNTQPYANRAGDLWINGGDDNAIYTATAAGYNWTEKPNAKYASKTSLNSKLNATAYIVQSAVDNKISANASGFEVYAGSSDTASSGVKITSAGILGYKNGNATFTLTSAGDATFAGEVRAASGWFGDSYAAGWAISGNQLLGNSPSGGTQLILDATNGTITGGKITGSAIVGNTITGGTITGAKIQTSTSANRVQIVDATTDSLQVVYGSTVRGHVLAAASSGILMHYGATANANATTYGLLLLGSGAATLAADSNNYFLVNTTSTTISGEVSTVNGGFTFNSGGNTYFQKTTTGATTPSTTTSNANAYLNSSTGQLARSTSSRRYKTNIKSISVSDDSIKLLNPVKFQGISDIQNGDETYKIGLIAEEVAAIPELELLVNYNEDGSPEALAYDRLAVVLMGTIKRILNRLDALEA
jgi:hypothetical protein